MGTQYTNLYSLKVKCRNIDSLKKLSYARCKGKQQNINFRMQRINNALITLNAAGLVTPMINIELSRYYTHLLNEYYKLYCRMWCIKDQSKDLAKEIEKHTFKNVRFSEDFTYCSYVK